MEGEENSICNDTTHNITNHYCNQYMHTVPYYIPDMNSYPFTHTNAFNYLLAVRIIPFYYCVWSHWVWFDVTCQYVNSCPFQATRSSALQHDVLYQNTQISLDKCCHSEAGKHSLSLFVCQRS